MKKTAYNTQVGGDHYRKYKIQPSEFINKNKLLVIDGVMVFSVKTSVKSTE